MHYIFKNEMSFLLCLHTIICTYLRSNLSHITVDECECVCEAGWLKSFGTTVLSLFYFNFFPSSFIPFLSSSTSTPPLQSPHWCPYPWILYLFFLSFCSNRKNWRRMEVPILNHTLILSFLFSKWGSIWKPGATEFCFLGWQIMLLITFVSHHSVFPKQSKSVSVLLLPWEKISCKKKLFVVLLSQSCLWLPEHFRDCRFLYSWVLSKIASSPEHRQA